MKLRQIIPAGVMVLGLMTGFGIVQAGWHPVPGVDIPFDSDAYYSPTIVSEPDSAPSVFALRELSQGTVLDPIRKAKSILFGGDFSKLSGIMQNRYLNELLNRTGWGAPVLQQVKTNMDEINRQSQSISMAVQAVDSVKADKLFRSPDGSKSSYERNNKDYRVDDQIKAMNEYYQGVVQASADNMDDLKKQNELLNEIMQHVANAQGQQQQLQAKAELEAFIQAQLQRRNVLLGNWAGVKAMDSRFEASRDVEVRINRKSFNANGIADPYDTSHSVYNNWQRPEPLGLPDMKN